MRYNIFSNGKQVNSIVADEDFCKQYCNENGYTYELIPDIEDSLDTPTPIEQLRADVDFIAVMTGVEL